MKQVTLILIALFILVNINAQQQRLKKGDEFNFRTTSYNNTVDHTGIHEGVYRHQTTYKVLDASEAGYRIQYTDSLISSYNRQKSADNKQWQSGVGRYPSINPNIHDEHSNRSFSLYNFKDVIIQISPKGELKDIEIKDSLFIKHPEMESTIKKAFKKYIKFPIINLPETTKIGEEIELKDGTFKVTDTCSEFITLIKNVPSPNKVRIEYKINPNTGIIIEQQSYNKDSTAVNNIKNKIKRMILVKESPQPYACQFSTNHVVKDTTLINTNVTIRGKITNPSFKHPVKVTWYSDRPGGSDNYEIITPLKKDSTFEIKLYTNDLKRIKFLHKEYMTLNVMPGDNIFLTVDLHHFDETIRATGIGSNHVQFYIDRFLFCEKENLNSNTYYPHPDLCKTMSHIEYKRWIDQFVEKRIHFLDRYQSSLSPEIYWGAYYELHTMAIQHLLSFKRHKYYFSGNNHNNRKKIDIPQEFYDFENWIHPDNDIMSFADNYNRFIRAYAFFYLDEKMEEIVGKGNLVDPSINNYLDFVYQTNYGYSAKFFGGITQYTLKFETAADAIERGSRNIYTQLYNRFLKEYSNTENAKILADAFKRAEKSRIGELAYDFTLEDIDGNSVKLSDFKGKAVYISFIRLQEHFKKANEDLQDSITGLFGDKNIEFLFISMNTTTPKDIESITNYSVKGIKLSADIKESSLLRDNFFFSGLPHAIIIDVNGRIADRDAPAWYSELVNKPEVLVEATKIKRRKVSKSEIIQNLLILLFIIGGILLIGAIIFIYYSSRTRRKIKTTELTTKVRELELTAIRAQMNPHFMYNCLNSIQNLVQKKQNDEAHLYLSKFAKLIRSVLNNSDKEEISLATELEMISNYVELEQLRFDIKFIVDTNNKIDPYSVFIPPLILQPLVENAILHGLAPKQGERKLSIDIKYNEPGIICVSIVDNGVGRNQNEEKLTTSNGKGIKFSQERLNLLAQKYGTEYKMEIDDLKDKQGLALGTKVQICFPEE